VKDRKTEGGEHRADGDRAHAEAADVQLLGEALSMLPACSLRPKNALITHPSRGKSGISQRVDDNSTCWTGPVNSGWGVVASSQIGELVGEDASVAAIDLEHDGQGDRGLARREHDDENGEHLARDAPRDVMLECHEVEGGGVENELDPSRMPTALRRVMTVKSRARRERRPR